LSGDPFASRSSASVCPGRIAQKDESDSQGAGLRRFLSLTFACTLLTFAGLARAQQIDLLVGGSTLFSPKNHTASEAFLPPAQNGAVYPSVGAQIVYDNHFGFNAETSFRYKEGLYNGYQRFRPVFYDFNAVYAPRFTHKTTGDFMAGIGGETLIFYNQYSGCPNGTGVCSANINATHFLMHAGGGVRYYFWRHFFVRPEAHYSYIVGNTTQFHSHNLMRVGASIGYTWGSR